MSQIALDELVSPNLLEHHAKIDQYQTYSLLIDDETLTVDTIVARPGRGDTWGYSGPIGGWSLPEYTPPGRVVTSQVVLLGASTCIAVDTFVPGGKVPIDFTVYAKRYPRKIQQDSVETQPLSYVAGGFNSFDGAVAFPVLTDTTSSPGANYHHLITGHPLDPRALPQYYRGIATSTRRIRWGYYRRNELEQHPRVLHTIDWIAGSTDVEAGKPYKLPISNPALGTLWIDSRTKAELVDLVGDYPKNLVCPGGDLDGLIAGWTVSYYSQPEPLPFTLVINGVTYFNYNIAEAQGHRWADTYNGCPDRSTTEFKEGDNPHQQHDPAPATAIYRRETKTYTPRLRILAANNDRWGHGSPIQDYDPPGSNHTLFGFNNNDLHYAVQTDGSTGTLIMDSARIKDIWAALGAGYYAQDSQGDPRVVNLGWMIEKLTNWAGIRRKPNGDFLSKDEAEPYKRQRLNKPEWRAGQFSDREWGNQGMAIPYLPTSYKNGQRQDNQYDLVSSLPDLLLALHDQIDASQGIQHNGEIRLPIGGKVQSYPNQGAMLTDLALRVAEMEGIIEKMLVMQVETSNSVRELFPGIGIPVTTKSIPVKIGDRTENIRYPAFQAGKGSVTDRLVALAQNLGIVIGALMPRGDKGKDRRMNPFDHGPK